MSNKEPSKQPMIDTSGMSDGMAAAIEITEAARESEWSYATFAGQIFMGRLPWDIIVPYPEQSPEDAEAGQEFLGKLQNLLSERTDPDQIDRDGEIPEDVVNELAALGAFGIKIPEEYGGLGLSQYNYCRAAVQLGSHCGNLTALLSAHQSIGIPQPLLQFGTDEQKKEYLPRVAKGEISAFALTETGVGSDPARMATKAEPTEDGSHFLINGEKLWCTNGTRAGLIVVMAQTPPKVVRGKEKSQITAFIVEADSPGITIEHRCRFMGLKSLYNAVITFKDVKVPRENIIEGEGRGLKVALTTLNTGRLTLPAGCTGLAKRCLEVMREWSNEREQWGSPIGHHAAIANKVAMAASNVFAMEAMTMLTAALVDRKKTDIRLEAAMCKMWCSEAAWRIVDETMATRGGRGYETAQSLKARGEKPIAVERFMRDCRINMIFEGSSEIMRLFIAREALDPHLNAAGAVVMPGLSGAEKTKAALKALKFYAGWYPKQWMPFGSGAPADMDPALAKHARYAAGTSRRLARTLFHAMARLGPKLEREQILVSRFVDIGTELFAIAAVCSRAQSMISRGDNREEVIFLADYFCREARLKIGRWFRGIGANNDRHGYKFARRVLDGDYAWLESGMV